MFTGENKVFFLGGSCVYEGGWWDFFIGRLVVKIGVDKEILLEERGLVFYVY